MVENNKPSHSTIEAERFGPIKVKVIKLHKMEPTEYGKQDDHRAKDDDDKLGPRDLSIPVGPFRPIKNMTPPAIVEEYKDENY